eukprot:848031-Amphidinium_carterae.1
MFLVDVRFYPTTAAAAHIVNSNLPVSVLPLSLVWPLVRFCGCHLPSKYQWIQHLHCSTRTALAATVPPGREE